MQTILTGVRVNEEPTIGNFLGAYTPMINLSHEHAEDSHTNFFVPDLHSFTTPIDHSKLYDQTIKGIKYSWPLASIRTIRTFTFIANHACQLTQSSAGFLIASHHSAKQVA